MSPTQHNLDLAEIQKFNALAKDWWDKSGSMRALHDINPLRLSFIQQHANLADKNILDIGCGAGILSESLSKAGANFVLGIDLAHESIAVATQHAKNQNLNIDYQTISVEALAKTHNQSFDVITCMELLEHVPNPESIIASCSQLLKPGGQIFFSTINRNPKSFLMAIVGAEYALRLIPKGTHHYKKFIKPSELDKWARKSSLHSKHITGMHYNPISKEYSLGGNVDVNYLVHYEKA